MKQWSNVMLLLNCCNEAVPHIDQAPVIGSPCQCTTGIFLGFAKTIHVLYKMQLEIINSVWKN